MRSWRHDTAAKPSLPRPPCRFALMRNAGASASRSSRAVGPFGFWRGPQPRPARSLPIRHILVRALAPFDTIGAKRNDVVRAVRTGRRVLVFVRPRVLRRRRLLPVRTRPVREPGRRSHERLQTFLRRRIAAELELEQVERLRNLLDLDLRGLGLGLLALAEVIAADDAEHDADQ